VVPRPRCSKLSTATGTNIRLLASCLYVFQMRWRFYCIIYRWLLMMLRCWTYDATWEDVCLKALDREEWTKWTAEEQYAKWTQSKWRKFLPLSCYYGQERNGTFNVSTANILAKRFRFFVVLYQRRKKDRRTDRQQISKMEWGMKCKFSTLRQIDLRNFERFLSFLYSTQWQISGFPKAAIRTSS